MTNHSPQRDRLSKLIPSPKRLAGSAALIAATAVVVAPVAAHADTVPLQGSVTGTATLTVPDVTKASNCTNDVAGGAGTKIPFTISVNADDDYSYVSYDLYVLDSDGTTVDATDYAFAVDETSSGTYTGSLCSTLPVGTYTAGGLICFDAVEDACADATVATVVTDRYRINPVVHHYTVSVSRSGTTVTGTVKDSGRAVARAAVTVQKWSGGRWVAAAHETTNSAGRVAMVGSYGSAYRVVYGTAASPTVRIPKAGSTLRATRAKQGRHAWRITGTLGGAVHAGKRVYLQHKVGANWRNTGKSCTTAGNGKCSVTFTQSRNKNGVWYRLAFNMSPQKNAASSGRFHITRR